MTLERLDRILLGLGTILILISSCQLFLPTLGSENGLKLGTLAAAYSVVKTKKAISLDWRDAPRGLDVSENQLIYTDKSSEAEVLFNEGNSLQIAENSLIRIQGGKTSGMNINEGFVRAKLANDRPLKVQMNGEDFFFKGKDAEIQINIHHSKGEVGVLKGEVSYSSEQSSGTLNPELSLEVAGTRVTTRKISYKVLSPANAETHYVQESSATVEFRWAPADSAKILVSKHRDLRDSVEYSERVLTLTPGQWYYRIDGTKGSSLIQTLAIVQELPIKILRPLHNEEVTLKEDKIHLQWEGEIGLQYLVEWNDGEARSKLVQGAYVEVPWTIDRPFSWRVKIWDKKRPDALWTEWQEVKINYRPLPIVPADLAPHKVEYQTYQQVPEKIELTWKGRGPFEIEIQNPSGHTDVRKVASTFLTIEAKEAGEYKWRVRSIDDFLRTSLWSEQRSFVLKNLSRTSEEEGVQVIQLTRPDQAVTFSWDVEGESSKNVFELARDKHFTDVVKKVELDKSSLQVNIPDVGTYFWRSRQLLPDGSIMMSKPVRVLIEPVPAPLKPEKMPDLHIEIEGARPKSSFFNRLLDLLIPSAIAREQGVLNITLPVKEEAKNYHVRIYRDEELTDLIYEAVLEEKVLEWRHPIPGTYYLQYAITDFWNRTSPFSDPSKLIVREAEIVAPVKPRLLSPVRALEVDRKNIVFRWTPAEISQRYKVEIASDQNFKDISFTKETSENSITVREINLPPALYFWRVHAFNNKGESVLSNRGRFIILPEQEKLLIQDFPQAAKIENKSLRTFFGWSPSLDSYKFKNVKSGEIEGNTLTSFFLSGRFSFKNSILSGEILRQSGKVFGGQNYLYQRALLDYIYNQHGPRWGWGIGVVGGQTSAYVYDFQGEEVRGKSTSVLSYGGILRTHLTINSSWELQGKVMYLHGEIQATEAGMDAIRRMSTYLFLTGINYSIRSYDKNSGRQTSMRFSLGIGKEF